MKVFIALFCLVGAAYAIPGAVVPGYAAAIHHPYELNIPNPYQFGYSADSIEGTHSHTEVGDGVGRVEGSYTMQLADGRVRKVTYYADETGFHPTIETNELGTESKPAADAPIYSAAPSGPEAAIATDPLHAGVLGHPLAKKIIV